MDERIEVILRGSQFKKILEDEVLELRKKYGLKQAELEIINFLSCSGENNTSTDIHRHLLMNRGHISQAVDGLIKHGYLRSVPDEKDRRYIHYFLTDAALPVAEAIQKTQEEVTRMIFDGFSQEEIEMFQALARKMAKNMEKLL